MKIGNSQESAAAAAAVNTEKPKMKAGQSAGSGLVGSPKQPAPEASAQLELSSTAASLMASTDEGSFDVEKVNRISQAISEGKFTINPDAIADKLISNAQELLSRPQTSH